MLEKDYPKGSKISDFPNKESVLVREFNIDISSRTIDLILFGPDYKAPATVPNLKYRLTTTPIQRPWLFGLLTDDSNTNWATNP